MPAGARPPRRIGRRSGRVDRIDCGAGNDVVWLNAKETTDVHVNCETVKTVTVSGDGSDS